jgi:hypothetical protein
VWVPNKKAAKPYRMVIPTSQVFLDDAQSLDTKKFDAWMQKSILNYHRNDISKLALLPATLARNMVQAVTEHANTSQEKLQKLRNKREHSQR